MFEELIAKLDVSLKRLRGMGKLSEKAVAEALRDIRRVFLEADVHYKVAKDFVESVQSKAVGTDILKSITPGQAVIKIVQDELVQLLGGEKRNLQLGNLPPSVIMAVGLQGSGKTTFVVKLGVLLKKQGRSPLLVAADTYRPAAVDQLKTLASSAGLEIFSGKSPIQLSKDAVVYARKHAFDTLILDTAGRLHVDAAMMEELRGIKDALKPQEILFVADGMTGQDAVRSAQAFLEKLDFTGIVLTKMDGDAKGGAALSIRMVTGKPIKFLSLGEKPDSLDLFYPERMASRILGMGDVVSLVEKAQEAVDRKEAERLAKRLKRQDFDLEDFFSQIQQIKKMGPLQHLASLFPGVGTKLSGMEMDEKSMVRVEAMIQSMTVEERQKPAIIDGSRRKRIAIGSGTTVQEVNKLLRQFQMMQKMMKQVHRSGRMPPGLHFGS